MLVPGWLLMAAVAGEVTVGALPDSDPEIFPHFHMQKSLADFFRNLKFWQLNTETGVKSFS